MQKLTRLDRQRGLEKREQIKRRKEKEGKAT